MAGQQKESSTGAKKKRKSRAIPKENKEADDSRQLTRDDYIYILDWLQSPDNQAKIQGTYKAPKVGSKPTTKLAGFRELASYVNSQPKNVNLPPVLGESMKGRWKYFFDKYRDVKKETSVTGYGVSRADKDRGIWTVPDKQKDLFEFYHEMDALFGTQPNVLPDLRHTTMAGIPTNLGDGDSRSSGLAPEDVDLASSNGCAAVEEALTPSHLRSRSQGNMTTPPPAFNIGNMGTRPPDTNVGDMTAPANFDTHGTFESPADGRAGGENLDELEFDSAGPELDPDEEETTPTSQPAQRKRKRNTDSRAKDTPDRRSTRPEGEKADGPKDSDYPPPKKVTESRHSMNSAFAYSLSELNDCRVETNKINKDRWQQDENYRREVLEEEKVNKKWQQAFEEKKFLKEIEQQGKEREERALDRQERAKTSKQQFMVGLVNASQGRGIDEIMKLIDEANK